MIVYIYSLRDPRDKRIRYIGKTNDLSRRYEQHRYSSGECRRERWLRGLFNKRMKPIMDVVEECDDSTWKERERYWIAFYKLLEEDLLNVSSGGDQSYSEKARDEWLRKIAKQKHIKIKTCYSCKRITLSEDSICNGCLNKLSNGMTDEWVKFYLQDKKRSRSAEKTLSKYEIQSGLLEDMENLAIV